MNQNTYYAYFVKMKMCSTVFNRFNTILIKIPESFFFFFWPKTISHFIWKFNDSQKTTRKKNTVGGFTFRLMPKLNAELE